MKARNTITITIFAINLCQNKYLKNKESIIYTTINITTIAITPRIRLSIFNHHIVSISPSITLFFGK